VDDTAEEFVELLLPGVAFLQHVFQVFDAPAQVGCVAKDLDVAGKRAVRLFQ
jgi:hypothetical protein